jgi:hypothetical protein
MWDFGDICDVDEEELTEFEKGFAPKEKKVTKTQDRFRELENKYL